MIQEPSDRLPRSAWLRAARQTAIVIGCSIVVSVVVTIAILDTVSHGIDGAGLAVSIVMPIIIGTPVMFYLAVGRQRLKLANAQLAQLASIDWLTDCLNRRAFTREVTRQLAGTAPSQAGALLILDADHFKAINDRFGHERGDEALQLIAQAIKGAVRPGDLVGRLGGEEFAVFLPRTEAGMATQLAERICAAIVGQVFAPGGRVHPLSASLGGAVFRGAASFADLFRIADERLYSVKQTRRGRADLVALNGARAA